MARKGCIRLHAGFFESPVTRHIEAQLGPEGLVGLLRLCLWKANDAEAQDFADVERLARWDGEPGEFAAVLLETGLLADDATLNTNPSSFFEES